MQHRILDKIILTQPQITDETFATSSALRLVTAGYHQLAADYYWLRAINHFGNTKYDKQNYPLLPRLLSRTIDLDPLFAPAYIFAGTALTFTNSNYESAVKLLRRGEKNRPDKWRISTYLGFILYYNLGRYSEAAEAFGRAAQNPAAGPKIGELAARLSAEGGSPEIGMRILGHLMDTTEDKKQLEIYQYKFKLLRLDQELIWLQNAVKTHQNISGKPIKQLNELTTAPAPNHSPLLKELPKDPLGGNYFIDPQTGDVKSENDDKRLRISDQAKGVK